MNKRLILTCILLGALTVNQTTYGALTTLAIEGREIQVDAQNNKLYPLRKTCESLGIEVSRVTDEHIVLKQNNNIVTINRGNQYLHNTKGHFIAKSIPLQKDGQTYIDLEVLEKMFGYMSTEIESSTVISKIPNFTLPAPNLTGQKLNNDLSYIELIEEKINVSYYRAAIETGIKNYDIETITQARQKISNELKIITEVEVYLQSNVGTAVINSYKALLNAYSLVLNNAFNLNMREMINYLIALMEAEEQVTTAKNNFEKLLEKNATKL